MPVGPVGHASDSGLLVIVENLIDLLRRQVLEVHVVDHHHRRAVARREAFFFLLEVEAAVGRALTDLDAEALLDVREDVFAAAAACTRCWCTPRCGAGRTGLVSNIE